MATERPNHTDRTKTDPDVINKLTWLKHEVEIEAVIMKPMIEEAAMIALDDLNTLVNTLSADELDEEPNEDVLKNLYHNDTFVTNMVMTPTIFELIERTEQTVFLTDMEILGYAYVDPGELDEEDDGDENGLGVGLVVDDAASQIWLPIETPGEIQQTWDTSPRHIRQDLQRFAGLTKREIIDRFYEFIFEYANPGAEPVRQELND